MDEIQTLERMVPLDRPVHMDAAGLAGMALNQRVGVDDCELVAIFENRDAVMRSDGNDRKGRAGGLPALRATAGVIVGDAAGDLDLNRLVGAVADEDAAAETGVPL